MRRLREGLKTIAKVFFSAGARRVFLPTAAFTPLSRVEEIDLIDERVRTMRDIQCGSSHPQGGNSMSDDAAVGAVDSEFRVHGFDNLYVCDASVFPAPIQANPQLTVMALADYAAGIIAAA